MPMKRPSPRLLLRLIRFASHRRDSRVPRAKPQLQSRRPRWHGRLRPPLASLARRLSCRQGCCARPRGKAPKNFACGANTLPFFWPAAQRSPQNFRLRRRFSPTKIPFTLPLDAANPSRCPLRASVQCVSGEKSEENLIECCVSRRLMYVRALVIGPKSGQLAARNLLQSSSNFV